MNIITIWIILGIIGTIIAARKGGGFLKWLFIGVLFGPLALIHAAVSGVRCPVCGKMVNLGAKMCPFCRLKMPQREKKINFKQLAVEILIVALLAALVYYLNAAGYIDIRDPSRKVFP